MTPVSTDQATRAPRTADELVETARRLGEDVLAAHADDVDARSRFPSEAIDALREAGLLGALVPTGLGGLGLPLEAVARATTELGRHCSSAGMVFAMHQIQVACLVRHGTSEAMREYTREVAASQLLLASATSEVGIGGDIRSSSCAVESHGDRFSLVKQAPVISYGQHADAILTTARRAADSPPNDQVLVVCRRDGVTLEPTSTWDALGFRGTCSLGFVLTAEGASDDVLPVAFADICAQTMVPVSHLLWASLWLGMASAAEEKARRFVQSAARRTPDTTPPGAARLAEVAAVLQQFHDLVEVARERHGGPVDEPATATTVAGAVSLNSLKVSASSLVVDVVQRALLVCGMAGYANQSPFTLGRLLRDAYGAQLMINNDRVLANTAQLLLVHRGR